MKATKLITWAIVSLFLMLGWSCERIAHEELAPQVAGDTTFLFVTDSITVVQEITLITVEDTLYINPLDNHVLHQFLDIDYGFESGDLILQLSSTDSSAQYTILSSSIPSALVLNQITGEFFVSNGAIFEDATVSRLEVEVLVESEQYEDLEVQVVFRLSENNSEYTGSMYPLHYLSFNESNFLDYYDNSKVSTTDNQYFSDTDRHGNEWGAFRGQEDYTLYLSQVKASVEDDFTLSLWFKLDSNATTSDLQYLVTSRFNFLFQEAGGFSLFIQTNRSITAVFRRRNDVNGWANNLGAARTTSGMVEEEVWYHIILRKKGGFVEVFLDNELIAQTYLSDFPNDHSRWQLGGLTGSSGVFRTLDGLIDDVLIFNRALTDEDLLELDSFDIEDYPTVPL